MIIKVSGMTDGRNIAEVERAGADIIGLDFVRGSASYVATASNGNGLLPDKAADGKVAGCINAVKAGIFMDASIQEIILRTTVFKLDMIHLHGNETATFMRNIRATVDDDIMPGMKYMKTVRIDDASSLEDCRGYEDCADYILLMPSHNGRSITETALLKTIAERYNAKVPFLIGGGIMPDDANKMTLLRHPMFAGADIGTGFESTPGMKDAAVIGKFIEGLHA